ncbi:MAG: DUF177 domain-containing protein [Rhodobacter sp.]|nr:DUF177 domain-containing protein [Paracoccaceae bacterium]MCB1408646.1 DUF177 domain-containing protein [Paracoccaceae bacterium]MCC0078822.1 DUF177 domain-containing protein [Rhodobacter sp.]
MTDTTPLRETDGLSLPLRLTDLNARVGTRFRLTPTPEARAALAEDLGVERIRKLTFHGSLTPDGRHDWRLEGTLGATVVQACVVTAEPVTSRIDTAVSRHYLRRMAQPQGPEVEIPEDDTLEPLTPEIDPGQVMAEALALALPDYPRAEGADLPDSITGADQPDERPNPFAALAALKTDLPKS